MALNYRNSATQTQRSPWTRLVSMELTDEEKYDAVMPMPMDDKPDYPYGLRICLTEKELTKLELPADCQIGDMIDMRCFARVTSVSQNAGEDGVSCRVELQITDLALENEATEDTPGDPYNMSGGEN